MLGEAAQGCFDECDQLHNEETRPPKQVVQRIVIRELSIRIHAGENNMAAEGVEKMIPFF